MATSVPAGQVISATATDPAGNTSEFAADLAVKTSPTTTSLATDHASGSVYGHTVTLTSTGSGPTGAGAPTGSVQFIVDGINSGTPVTLSGGVATFAISTLHAGGHTFAASYTSDSTNFANSATASPLSETVSPAALTITADSKTKVYGAALPALTTTYSGFVNGDTSASLATLPTLSTTATATSDVAGYAITASGAADPDYTISYVAGALTITQASQAIGWSNPANIVIGTALGATQLNATVSVVGPAAAGGLTYSPAAGTVLGPGPQTLTVTAAATNDYAAATANVTIDVLYNFKGFLGPLDNQQNFAVHHVIPIKFQLADVNGHFITNTSAVKSLQIAAVNVNGSLGTPFDPASADKKGLHVDGDDDAFDFQWKTKGLAAGKYEIFLTLADGSVETKIITLVKGEGDDGEGK